MKNVYFHWLVNQAPSKPMAGGSARKRLSRRRVLVNVGFPEKVK